MRIWGKKGACLFFYSKNELQSAHTSVRGRLLFPGLGECCYQTIHDPIVQRGHNRQVVFAEVAAVQRYLADPREFWHRGVCLLLDDQSDTSIAEAPSDPLVRPEDD